MNAEQSFPTGEMVPLESLLPIWEEIFDGGGTVIFTPCGQSMRPFLRSGRDRVLLFRPKEGDLRVGQIALCRRPDGVIVLHRIVRTHEGKLTLCGDGLVRLERGIAPQDVIAVVEGFYRGERFIDCRHHRCYRLLSRLWMLLYPVRRVTQPILVRLKHIFCCRH